MSSLLLLDFLFLFSKFIYPCFFLLIFLKPSKKYFFSFLCIAFFYDFFILKLFPCFTIITILLFLFNKLFNKKLKNPYLGTTINYLFFYLYLAVWNQTSLLLLWNYKIIFSYFALLFFQFLFIKMHQNT